ncbi:MAG TPA: hypothetical protein VLT33_28940 [Labilithrix sp.]|nr:hypothetical protein [Labilithrix sp.]
MTQLPTLEDVAAQLKAQDDDLAVAAQLAETVPHGVTANPSFIDAIDDLTEAPAMHAALPPCGAIRA